MFNLVLHLLITFISLFSLIKGSEWLLKGSVVLANRLNISKLAIASTLIALGTGLPTIAVIIALMLSGDDSSQAVTGIAMGTNFVNLGIGLGIPAILVTITAKYEVFEKEILIFFAVLSIFIAFSFDYQITRLEGVFLLLLYFLILFIIYQYSNREKINSDNYTELDVDTSTIGSVVTDKVNIFDALMYIVLGLTVLVIASLTLAWLTPILSQDFNINMYVVGLTVIGVGTSIPTVVTSIRSAKKGYIDIVLGNVFGGTIANITLGFGITSLIGTLKFDSEAMADVYFLSVFSVVVLLLILIEMKLLGKNHTLSRVSGVIIVLAYVLYLISKFV